MIDDDVIHALYRAMLGREPEPAGLANWRVAPSVDDLIAALVATDRFRERSAALIGRENSSGSEEEMVRAAWRLAHTDGLVELTDLPAGLAAHAPLEALPWNEISAQLVTPTVRVIGRYATELTAELQRREPDVRPCAGLVGGEDPRCDVLVLTRSGDLRGLVWARPDVVRSVAQRLLLPVHFEAFRPEDERSAIRRAARQLLHDLGFIQVSEVARQKFGGGTVRFGTTLSGAGQGPAHDARDPGRSHLPPVTWLVASRVADDD